MPEGGLLLDTILLLLRLALALVFVVAALGKLTDRDGTRSAVIEFGAPFALAGFIAAALPVAELATAALLIVSATAWAGATASIVLLGVFTLAMAANLAQGRRPDCHCFGAISSEPIGLASLVRNGVLIVLAAVVVGAGSSDAGKSATHWLAELSLAEAVAVVIIVLTAAMLFASGRAMSSAFANSGNLLVRLDMLEERIIHGHDVDAGAEEPGGLPLGQTAPPFSIRNVDGTAVSLESLREPLRPLLLLFTDANCGPCNTLLPDVARWQRDESEFKPVVLSSGEPDAVRRKAKSAKLRQMLLDEEREVQALYNVIATPSAVLVAPDGRISSLLAEGTVEVRALALEASKQAIAS